jgi:hypothetical protein
VPCLIAIVAIVTDNRVKRQYYESLAKALESGKDPEGIKRLFGVDEARKRDPVRFLTAGIVIIGVGLGGALMGLLIMIHQFVAVGVFFGVLGLSFLAIYFLTRKQRQNN